MQKEKEYPHLFIVFQIVDEIVVVPRPREIVSLNYFPTILVYFFPGGVVTPLPFLRISSEGFQ